LCADDDDDGDDDDKERCIRWTVTPHLLWMDLQADDDSMIIVVVAAACVDNNESLCYHYNTGLFESKRNDGRCVHGCCKT
jgi:hypothetical protein